MLSVLLTVLNPALKPFYDAFYKVFLMVRSARIIDVIWGIHIWGRHPILNPESSDARLRERHSGLTTSSSSPPVFRHTRRSWR